MSAPTIWVLARALWNRGVRPDTVKSTAAKLESRPDPYPSSRSDLAHHATLRSTR